MDERTGVAGGPYREGEDDERVELLLLRCRAATGMYVYPTPWRLRLLLHSRVWDPRDVWIWPDAAGGARALAMLWRRRPTASDLVLERLVDPAPGAEARAEAALAWGVARARALAKELSAPLALHAGRPVGAGDDERALARHGFAPLEPDRDEYSLYMARPLGEAIPEPVLPAGYAIQRLRTAGEVEAYHRQYDFGGVSLKHRLAMLGSDECRLVAAADPERVFVAFGEVSICRREWAQRGSAPGARPGWVDHIGTRPQDRQRGLGRAIVLASLGELQALGAETALLLTTSTNRAALRLYETSGFARLDVPQPPGYVRPVPVEA